MSFFRINELHIHVKQLFKNKLQKNSLCLSFFKVNTSYMYFEVTASNALLHVQRNGWYTGFKASGTRSPEVEALLCLQTHRDTVAVRGSQPTCTYVHVDMNFSLIWLCRTSPDPVHLHRPPPPRTNRPPHLNAHLHSKSSCHPTSQTNII